MCKKYGMPMSKQNEVKGRTQICADGRTDRVIPMYPLNLVRGGYKTLLLIEMKSNKLENCNNLRIKFII